MLLGTFAILTPTSAILALVVIIGAILIYVPGKETIGSILVITLSTLSVIIGGGFFMGLILGIIGRIQ